MTTRPDRLTVSAPSSKRTSSDLALTVPASLIELIASRVAALIADRLPTDEASAYFTVEQAADYLACPKSRVYDLVKLRRVRHYRDGRRILFRREDLDAALDVEEPVT